MPIIATTGRKHWRVRLLVWTMYFILVTGSLTMLYPFGMMLAMSVCDYNDNMEQRLVPRFITEKLRSMTPDSLFRRYASMRMNIDDFNRRHRSRYVDFSYGLPGQSATGIFARYQRIRPVAYGINDPRFNRVVDDINDFKTWYVTGKDPQGVMPDDEGHMINMMVGYRTKRSDNTLNPTLDRYVEWLKARYHNSLKEVNKAYHEENEFWSDVLMPFEQPHLVTWLPDTRSLKVREFLEFKDDLAREDINFLVFPDLNYHTLFNREYNSEDRYLRQTGWQINSFYELKCLAHAPAVTVPHELFRTYFKNTFNTLDEVNLLFGSSFKSWEEIAFPTPETPNEACTPLLGAFIRYVLEQKADISFQEYLKKQFEAEGSFSAKYSAELPPIPDVKLPRYERLEKVLAEAGNKPDLLKDMSKLKDFLKTAPEPGYDIKDEALRKGLLAEAVKYAYGEFCTKNRDLWVEFVRQNCPVRYLEINDADAKYQKYLEAKHGTIEKMLSYYHQGLSAEDAARFSYKSFSDVRFPREIALVSPDRTYFFHRPVTDDVLGFIASDFIDPVRDVTVSTVEYEWGRYLEKKYGGVDGANQAHSVKYKSFDDVAMTTEIPRTCPKALQSAWAAFVADRLPAVKVNMTTGNMKLLHSFLDMQYRGDITALNAVYATQYDRFTQVTLPRDETNAKRIADLKSFLHYDWVSPYDLSVKGALPQKEFAAFLAERFGTVDKLNKESATYADLTNPAIPYDELEWADFNKQWIQKGFFSKALWGNYGVVLDFLTLHGRALFNTFVFCLASILVSLIVNPMCAYALSRFKLPYGHYILLFLLATMAFPPMVTMIPNFLMLKSLGLLNTYWALILPGMANGYSIFLLKGFFDSLPQELFEAGIIDGATEVQMFWRIAIPLSYPIMAVIALWSFTGAYGAFMFAFIVCQDPKLWTLMVFLYEFQQEHSTQLTMAALTLASVPTLIVFILAQRVILKGIVIPQMK